MAFGFAIIEGLSMVPSYAPGERVVVKYGATYSQGDVVLVNFKTRIDIKRVEKIENGQVFVCGDNAAISVDSRQNGPVTQDQIIGKVIYRLPRWLTRN